MPTEVWAVSTKGRREGKFSQKTSSVTDFLEELQTTMPIHSCAQLLKYVTDTKWVVFFVTLYKVCTKEIYCSQANCIIVHCHYIYIYIYFLIVRDLIVLPIQSSTGLLYTQISQFKEIINTTELEHSNYQQEQFPLTSTWCCQSAKLPDVALLCELQPIFLSNVWVCLHCAISAQREPL